MEVLISIISVIIFCVFIGMFLRLGRIEKILKSIAVHQGAITRTSSLPNHASDCNCRGCRDLRKGKT